VIPTPPWLSVALAERGVREVPGEGDSPRIVEYHATTGLAATDDEVPWCSAFVCWCFVQAGIAGTNSARARSWLEWGWPNNPPGYGAVVVLKRGRNAPGPDVINAPGHVGFLVGYSTPDELLILGGNQSNAVNIRSYSASRVLAYRWTA